ncbi:unnamed protein product [Moneuplotes crassus]|uniref:Uncharacterized protein n=1 Tax=Euplotes crassus TaxID=5936 RepID=A0AAD1UL95_EUPCR|nr:unnamed protein product [Moneuplotes crassus]
MLLTLVRLMMHVLSPDRWKSGLLNHGTKKSRRARKFREKSKESTCEKGKDQAIHKTAVCNILKKAGKSTKYHNSPETELEDPSIKSGTVSACIKTLEKETLPGPSLKLCGTSTGIYPFLKKFQGRNMSLEARKSYEASQGDEYGKISSGRTSNRSRDTKLFRKRVVSKFGRNYTKPQESANTSSVKTDNPAKASLKKPPKIPELRINKLVAINEEVERPMNCFQEALTSTDASRDFSKDNVFSSSSLFPKFKYLN